MLAVCPPALADMVTFPVRVTPVNVALPVLSNVVESVVTPSVRVTACPCNVDSLVVTSTVEPPPAAACPLTHSLLVLSYLSTSPSAGLVILTSVKPARELFVWFAHHLELF